MQRLDSSHNDQKNDDHDQEQKVLLDQDREQQIDDMVDQSLQIRSDEPVSELYIWGNDYYGQLGVGSDKVIHNLPKVCSFNIVVTDVSCGEEHTVFVQGDGGYVYAMGSNSEGRLGTGNPEMRSCNVPTLVDGLANIKKVSCGTSHTLALSEDGQVYAWGQAFYGALGFSPNAQGSLDNIFAPKEIPLSVFQNVGIKNVEAGSRHSIFVTFQNKVYGCGDANQGQLGLGDSQRDRVTEPTMIENAMQGFNIFQVACGKYHTLFLVENPTEGNRRELWACGANNYGQIGNNSNQNMFSPVRVDPRLPEDKLSQNSRSHKFKSVSAWHASAAVTEDGIMYVWGAGIFGEFKRPRKVKLQNNIRVQSVDVGGSFIVIVDQDNKIVVWGSNQNGEIGVGDSKVRNHPTRLETIEDKLISKVGVGGSFAFAIGKTTTRMENSIFDEAGNRSQLSGIQRNAASHIMDDDMNKDNTRAVNRSLNSLEEQLQQIALHSDSKKKQDSDSYQPQKPQDRSVGNYSNNNNAASITQVQNRFELAANLVSLQNNQASEAIPFVDDDRVKSLEEQISQLKMVIEDKETKINGLNEQAQQKHGEYQDKLHRFKEMQDQEMSMANKLREDNKGLRSDNDQLRDEVLELKQELREERKKALQQPAYLAPQRQDSGASYGKPPAATTQEKPQYFPGVNSSLQRQEIQRDAAPIAQSFSQQDYQPHYPSGSQQQQQQNVRTSLDSGTVIGQSPLPSKLNAEDLNFKQTYLRGETLTTTLPHGQSTNEPQPILQASDPLSMQSTQYNPLPRGEASYMNANADNSKHESVYIQRYQAANESRPNNTSGYTDQHRYGDRVSVEVVDVDRSREGSSAKIQQQQEYSRKSYTADNNHNSSDNGGFSNMQQKFSSQMMALKEMKDDNNQDLSNNHVRRGSQLSATQDDGSRLPRGADLQSNYSRLQQQEAQKDDNQSRGGFNNNGGQGYLRDRVTSGRVDNLRSMGNELMRPSSQDGSKISQSALADVKMVADPMRNSSSGFYQPSNKYSRFGGNSDYQRTDEDLRDQTNQRNSLPVEASEIQNRLRNANKYSQEQEFPSDTNVKRSVTPNATTSGISQTNNSSILNRVSYKPATYEQRSQNSAQKDQKDLSHYSGIGNDRRDGQSDYGMPTSNQKDQFLKQRPGSGNGRDPLYQTQNNLQSMSKYDNLMNSGVTTTELGQSKYGRESHSQTRLPKSSHNQEMGQKSPTKPPRSDIYANRKEDSQQQQYSSHIGQQASYKFTGGASANLTSTDNIENMRGPTAQYQPTDYKTRYSYEPLSSNKNEDPLNSNPSQLKSFEERQPNYRLSIDPVGSQGASGIVKNSSYTPSYTANTNIASGLNNADATSHQNRLSYQPRSSEYTYENNGAHQRSSDLNQRIPVATQQSSYATHNQIGAGEALDSKPRSPFTSQQVNDQQNNNIPASYGRPPTDFKHSQQQQNNNFTAKTAFTPQGSGRRSEALAENEPNNGRSSEDIRSKLARYKKEREDFELVRQGFRSKNQELPAGGSSGQQQHFSENTPVNMMNSGSGNGSYKFGTATENVGPGGNIFAVDHSANPVQAFQAHVTSGSPAFGQPEPSNNSRDIQQNSSI